MDAGVRKLTLDGFKDGAAVQLFDSALEKVLDSIDDPNTPTKAKRRITMTFDFATDEERRLGRVLLSVDTKTPGARSIETGIFLGRDKGVLVAVESPRQDEMFPDPERKPRVGDPAKGGGA